MKIATWDKYRSTSVEKALQRPNTIGDLDKLEVRDERQQIRQTGADVERRELIRRSHITHVGDILKKSIINTAGQFATAAVNKLAQESDELEAVTAKTDANRAATGIIDELTQYGGSVNKSTFSSLDPETGVFSYDNERDNETNRIVERGLARYAAQLKDAGVKDAAIRLQMAEAGVLETQRRVNKTVTEKMLSVGQGELDSIINRDLNQAQYLYDVDNIIEDASKITMGGAPAYSQNQLLEMKQTGYAEATENSAYRELFRLKDSIGYFDTDTLEIAFDEFNRGLETDENMILLGKGDREVGQERVKGIQEKADRIFKSIDKVDNDIRNKNYMDDLTSVKGITNDPAEMRRRYTEKQTKIIQEYNKGIGQRSDVVNFRNSSRDYVFRFGNTTEIEDRMRVTGTWDKDLTLSENKFKDLNDRIYASGGNKEDITTLTNFAKKIKGDKSEAADIGTNVIVTEIVNAFKMTKTSISGDDNTFNNITSRDLFNQAGDNISGMSQQAIDLAKAFRLSNPSSKSLEGDPNFQLVKQLSDPSATPSIIKRHLSATGQEESILTIDYEDEMLGLDARIKEVKSLQTLTLERGAWDTDNPKIGAIIDSGEGSAKALLATEEDAFRVKYSVPIEVDLGFSRNNWNDYLSEMEHLSLNMKYFSAIFGNVKKGLTFYIDEYEKSGKK